MRYAGLITMVIPILQVRTTIPDKTGIEYGVYGVPETFVIDKKGFIRYKHVGPVTDDILKKKILPLIEQLKAASI